MVDKVIYHVICIIELALVYLYFRGDKKQLTGSLELVFILSSLIIFSDSLWYILNYYNVQDKIILYLVNFLYFIPSIVAVYAWLRYVFKMTNSIFYHEKKYEIIFILPVVAVSIMTLTTPLTGFVFTIENGQYIRGTLFFLDSLIKIFYVLFSIVYAFSQARKQKYGYIRKQYLLLAGYGIPVLICGIFQATIGLDLNCVAPPLGLSLVHLFGLSNESRDNSELLKALANSYTASFIVNTDNHQIKTIAATGIYKKIAEMSDSLLYEGCIKALSQKNISPEDRLLIEKQFSIENVLEQLSNKNSYSFIYKVYLNDFQDHYNKATFMKAFGDEERHEIFVGIEKQEIHQILLNERENLENEKRQFEQVKESLTSTIASIIEARDIDSGEHVQRVKNFTQLICEQIMNDHPEYELNPTKVHYIVSGSALHDIGKIMIPDAILLKPERLTDEEFEIMKTHCIKGCEILDRIPTDLDKDYIKYIKEICRWHHEKYDGKGYPDGLVGEEIPISAQIVSLADCFDALTTKRVYKDALSKQEAIRMIVDGECGVFNEKVIDSFKKISSKL